MITELQDNQILVVGTNMNGFHYGGAAAQAHKDFGLEWGFCEGLCNKSYAFPTLTKNMEQRSGKAMVMSRAYFYHVADENPDKEFLLTPVGTGIAGYSYDYIHELFRDLPINVTKVGWERSDWWTAYRLLKHGNTQ